MLEQTDKRNIAIKFAVLFVLPALQVAVGQPPPPVASEPQPAAQQEPRPVDSPGLEGVLNNALATWKRKERDLKSQIELTCNPDRLNTLQSNLLDARKPYDDANMNYWVYQQTLAAGNFDSDDPGGEVYRIEDFKKGLKDAEAEVIDKTKQKQEAEALLATLTAQQEGNKAAGKSDETNLEGRISAQKQLVDSLVDLITQANEEVKRKTTMIELGTNIKAGKEARQVSLQNYKLYYERQVKAAGDEATLGRARVSDVVSTRKTSCLHSSTRTRP